MPRLQSLAALVAAALLSSACYRVTVVTNAAPSAKVVSKPWNHSFVYGIVPPSPVDVAQPCGGAGVSRVVTQRSFLNGLVGSLTYGIYTPLQVTATCAAGGRTSSLGTAPAPVADGGDGAAPMPPAGDAGHR